MKPIQQFFNALAIVGFCCMPVAAIPPSRPDWLRFDLKIKSMLTDIYKDSIAQNIFIRPDPKSFAPPIQHIKYSTKISFEEGSRELSRRILGNLDVDLQSPSTIQLSNDPYKAGPARNLPAHLLKYQSSDGRAVYVTCMAIVKEGEDVHAVYTQALFSSLPDCTTYLRELTYNQILFTNRRE